MPIFYRGIAPDTYWYSRDVEIRSAGFTPHAHAGPCTLDRLRVHVARGATTTPFISVTRSYGVAKSYASAGSTRQQPGYVYEIEAARGELAIWDPVLTIAADLQARELPYQHDGYPDVLLGVINERLHGDLLHRIVPKPPPDTSLKTSANLPIDLQVLVRSLRDAELLVMGSIPGRCIVERYAVYEDNR